MATTARTPMMAITIISSTSVKPAVCFCFVLMATLPIRVPGAVQGRSLGFGMHVEDALSAVGVRRGVVLHGTQAPFGVAGHGVDGDTAQEFHLLALDVDAVDESFEIGRIVLAVNLGLECAFVRGVF